jgi:hypothetical protein
MRKYESGHQKRQKKQRIEKLTQSQKGAMDRFIIREPQVSSPNNDTVGQGAAQDTENADDPNPNDDQPEIENIVEQVPDNIDGTNIDVNLDSSHTAQRQLEKEKEH